MPSPIYSAIRPIAFWLALAAIFAASAVQAAEKSAHFERQVAAKKWSAVRLRNVRSGTHFHVVVVPNGPVAVLMLSSKQYAALETAPRAEEALFRSNGSDKLDFSLVAPGADDYYLVFDNRGGDAPRSVSVDIQGTLEPGGQQARPETISIPSVDQAFDRLTAGLRRAFIFDRLDFHIARCQSANAYSNRTNVYLCVEYVNQMFAHEGRDKEKLKEILLFTLMHEVGHALFTQWQYPFNDNEEIVDEFATVLLVMLNQRKAVDTQAAFFSSLPPEAEFQQQIAKDKPHPLSIQRARNLRRWLAEPGLVGKWQPLMIPHMQTDFLTALRNKNPQWPARDLLEREIAVRQTPPPR